MRWRTAIAVGALVLGGSGFAGIASATPDEPDDKNCPPGFTWIRMSGTGCVQEDLPANGKIGYDGNSLCIDGYVGIYERRATTDGEPAPGGPYTSFAYLLSCVTPEEYARGVERLAEREDGPSTLRTGAAGLAIAGGLSVLGGAAVLANRRRTRLADEAAAQERRDRRRQALQDRLAALTTQRQDLDRLAVRIRASVDDDSWGWGDVNEIVGLLTSFTGIKQALSIPAGIASLLSTSGGQAQGVFWDTDEIREQMRDLLESVELLRGATEGEVDAINRDLAEPATETGPDRLPAESYTDHDVLQQRIDEVNQEISELSDVRHRHEMDHARLDSQLSDVDHEIYRLRNQLADLEYGEINHELIASGGAAVSILAGIAALGPLAPAAAIGAGVVSALGSTASFVEWLRGASVEDAKRAIAFGIQGYQHVRGRIMYQMDDAAARAATAEAKLDAAQDYKARLRAQQGDIIVKTGRGVLWTKE